MLARLAHEPNADLEIAEVALQLAADEYPDLDVPIYLSRIDQLAEDLQSRLHGRFEQRVETLCSFLFDEQGFTGNGDEYYDPRNSYLSDVLDRRLGIPITLSVLAVAVGQRCELDVVGLALPGHFIAMARAEHRSILFDPFNGGQFLSDEACETLVGAVTGSPFQFTHYDCRPAPLASIVLRMLSNLKAIYLQTEDFRRAVRIMERLRILVPGDVMQRRDIGVSLLRAGEPGRAIDHLAAFLRDVPNAEDRETVEELLRQAKSDVAKWN